MKGYLQNSHISVGTMTIRILALGHIEIEILVVHMRFRQINVQDAITGNTAVIAFMKDGSLRCDDERSQRNEHPNISETQ